LLLEPGNPDPQFTSPQLEISATGEEGAFVRIRAAAAYPATEEPQPFSSQWFWSSQGEGFGGDRNTHSSIKQDGMQHIYWTYIPASEAGPRVTQLRFDPANAQIPVEIGWIAVDLVR
jgi:hypothetical protein